MLSTGLDDELSDEWRVFRSKNEENVETGGKKLAGENINISKVCFSY